MYKLVIEYSRRVPAKGTVNGAHYKVIRLCDGAVLSLRKFANAVGLSTQALGSKLKLWEYGEYEFKFQIQVRMMLDRQAKRDEDPDYSRTRPEEFIINDLRL